jgi:hypothetical protein
LVSEQRVLVVVLAGALLVWGGYCDHHAGGCFRSDRAHRHDFGGGPRHGSHGDGIAGHVPIEAALAARACRVRSMTAVGVAIIWTEFDWGEDIYRARQTVTE